MRLLYLLLLCYCQIIFIFSFCVIQSCGKPSFDNMLCPFPTDLRRNITDHVDVKISLYLDGVTTWVDLSSYPQFNSITIVPDPVIYKFLDGVFILKTTAQSTLEIKVGLLIIHMILAINVYPNSSCEVALYMKSTMNAN